YFGLAHALLLAVHRRRSAVRYDGLREDESGHRAVDIDMFLYGFAGGRDLPAEQMCGRIFFDRALDRIALGAVLRPEPGVKRGKLAAGAPVVVQHLRSRRNLMSVEHNSQILKSISSNNNFGLRP